MVWVGVDWSRFAQDTGQSLKLVSYGLNFIKHEDKYFKYCTILFDYLLVQDRWVCRNICFRSCLQ